MKKPALIAVALWAAALLFGWEARQAWLAPAPAADNTGRSASGLWQPGAPVPDPAPAPETASAVAAIAARPLFRPDREPYREQANAAAMARNYEGELSRFALIGTLTFGGELKGIVVNKGGGPSERWEVKAGDELPGFTVKEVQVDGLALSADGRDFQLPLYAGAPTGISVRTDVPRRDATRAAQPQPGSAAPPAVTAPRSPAIPQGIPPVYIPDQTPSRPPRYYPRRR